MFYVLDVELEMLAGDRVFTAGNTLVNIPKNTVHAFQVNSRTARLLNLYTPGGFERAVTGLGQPASRKQPPDPMWKQPRVSDKRRQHLFADVGLQRIAVADPFRP